MERMEYDPEGGNYLPVTEHETGATLIVVGLVMLIAAAGWASSGNTGMRGGAGGLLASVAPSREK